MLITRDYRPNSFSPYIGVRCNPSAKQAFLSAVAIGRYKIMLLWFSEDFFTLTSYSAWQVIGWRPTCEVVLNARPPVRPRDL